ncbi:MAG: MaoC family dehydratase [Candidatus Binataceae bacterium]
MKPSVRFCDVTAGMQLDGFKQDVSQEYIDRYALGSLDLNPIHIDPEWSSRAQTFGRPKTVLHGMATMSLMASVVTRAWGPTTQITRMKSKFTKPVWVGQILSFKGVVKELHYLNPGHNFVVINVQATDSENDLVGFCDIDVRLPG